MEFVAIRCPVDNAVLFEVGPGVHPPSRHRCRKCRQRYTAEGSYPNVEVWMVDRPQRVIGLPA